MYIKVAIYELIWLHDVRDHATRDYVYFFLQIKADGGEFSMEQFIKNANLNITEEVKITIEWKCILLKLRWHIMCS